MRYAAARALIRTGDILAFRESGPVSRFIQMWTRSTWNHCGVAWVYRGRVFVIEARVASGVSMRALSRALPCDWITIGKVDRTAIEQVALSRLGLPYDIPDDVRVGLNLEPSAHGEICSTFAGECLAAGGIELPRRGMTPEQIVGDLLDRGCALVRLAD